MSFKLCQDLKSINPLELEAGRNLSVRLSRGIKIQDMSFKLCQDLKRINQIQKLQYAGGVVRPVREAHS